MRNKSAKERNGHNNVNIILSMNILQIRDCYSYMMYINIVCSNWFLSLFLPRTCMREQGVIVLASMYKYNPSELIKKT